MASRNASPGVSGLGMDGSVSSYALTAVAPSSWKSRANFLEVPGKLPSVCRLGCSAFRFGLGGIRLIHGSLHGTPVLLTLGPDQEQIAALNSTNLAWTASRSAVIDLRVSAPTGPESPNVTSVFATATS
jgi:hypothetical protein